jgi:hypothetical protein
MTHAMSPTPTKIGKQLQNFGQKFSFEAPEHAYRC